MKYFFLFATLFSFQSLSAQDEKPFVIPELRDWTGSNGTTEINIKSSIVLLPTASAEENRIANVLISDYRTMFGIALKIKKGKPGKGDIFLFMEPELLREKGEEAYEIKTDGTITLSANNPKGLYWSTRTLLQMREQTAQLQNGHIIDYPDYPVRGFMLDAGRKFFSMDYLKKIVQLMSYYKMNTFQVHLNDNGFKEFFQEDWDKTYAAFRLESETYPGLAAKDGHYSKKEFRDFQKDALQQGVTIIPEIDAPAHTLAFTHYKPEIGSTEYGMDHVDLFNPETYRFLDGLFKEYLVGNDPVFVNKYVHIGTDEYSNKDTAVVEKFRYFTDYYIKYIESFGKQAAMWGALTHAKGSTPVKVKDVLMYCWYNGYANPKDMIEAGYNVLSVPDGSLYIVPAAGYYHDYLNIKNLYEKWTPAVIGNETFKENHPQIKGGMFCVWNDHVGNGISYQDVYHRIFPAMQTLSVKMWTGKNTSLPFETFNAQRNRLSEAPGLNLLAIPSKNKRGIVLQKKVISKGKPLNGLPDIGYNYKVSFDLFAEKNTKGTILFQSDNAVFYLTDPEKGMFGFSRDGYNYQFNYAAPVGEKVKISVTGTNKETQLWVNDVLQDSLKIIPLQKNKKGETAMYFVQTLIFPLKNAGVYNGTVKNLTVEYLGE